MFDIPIERLLGGLVGFGLGVGIIIKLWKDYRAWGGQMKKEHAAQRRGLQGNPLRCEDHQRSIEDHEGRMRKLEGLCERFDERFKGVHDDIGDIKKLLERAPWAK